MTERTIWRNVILNESRCPVCGTQLLLLESGQEIEDNLMVGLDLDGHPTMLFCGNCGLYVGRREEDD